VSGAPPSPVTGDPAIVPVSRLLAQQADAIARTVPWTTREGVWDQILAVRRVDEGREAYLTRDELEAIKEGIERVAPRCVPNEGLHG
jgi:hypothetical protein